MRNKWSEQEMIQTRRSVSSSPSSESENNDMQDENKHQQKMVTHITNLPNIPTSSNEMDQVASTNTMRTTEAAINESVPTFSAPQQSIQHPPGLLSQFNIPNENGPVSLFPPTSGAPSHNTQVPFPSPGAAMFPPTFANAFSSATSTANAQPTSKHGDTLTPNSTISTSMNYPSNLCAAFTSSSRNMAMMAPLSVQSDVSSHIASPNGHNLLTSISPHITGNSNNNNNISNSNKIDYNRKYRRIISCVH